MNKYVVEIVTRSYGWDQATAMVKADSEEEALEKVSRGEWDEVDYEEIVDYEYIDHELASEWWMDDRVDIEKVRYLDDVEVEDGI